jgi:hypothetical protein
MVTWTMTSLPEPPMDSSLDGKSGWGSGSVWGSVWGLRACHQTGLRRGLRTR